MAWSLFVNIEQLEQPNVEVPCMGVRGNITKMLDVQKHTNIYDGVEQWGEGVNSEMF